MAVFIAMLCLFCYGHGFTNDFTWDGRQYILANNHLAPFNWPNIVTIFSSFELGNYHPFTILSYAIEAIFVGQKDAYWYHVNQVILHGVNSFLLYKIFYRITLSDFTAVLGSLLFLLHPLHVESVIWEGERKDTFYCLFLLLSFWHYCNYVQKNAIKPLMWALLFFVCSCLSKAMAVVLPALLVVSDVLIFKRKINMGLINEKAFFWLIALFFGWLATKAQKDIGADGSAIFARIYTWPDRISMASYSFMFYWYKLFIPLKLSAFYPFPAKPFTSILLYSPIILTLFTTSFLLYFRKNYLLIWCFLFYGISIFPVLQLLPIGSAIVAERYFYVSSIGPILLVALAFQKIKTLLNFTIAVVLATIILFYFSILTHKRVKVWKNDLSLFQNVLEQFPANGFINGNVGWYYEGQASNADSALHYFNKSNALGWNTADIAAKKGTILFEKKQYQNSIAELKTAIKLNPKYQNIYWMLAASYFYTDSLDQANNYLKLSEKLDSSAFYAYNIKGLIAQENQDFKLSEQSFKKAIEIYGGNEEPYLNLAHLYYVNAKPVAQIQTLQKLIKNVPLHEGMTAYKNLGAALIETNKPVEAIKIWQIASQKINDKDSEILFNIGLQYGLLDNADQAIFWLKKAAKLQHAEAQNILKNKNISWQ